MWVLYELPDLDGAVREASFYACDVDNTCDSTQPWTVSWFTGMFLHASWGHLLGNMLYLAIFGKNVEEAFGRLGSLAFYVAGGLVATVPMRGSRRSSSCSLPVSPRGFYLGGWFLYPFLEGRYALLHPDESGSGVAFAAHVGGFSSACSPPTRSSAPVGSGPGVAAAIGALAVVIATDAGPRATVTQDLQSILVYFLVADALV